MWPTTYTESVSADIHHRLISAWYSVGISFMHYGKYYFRCCNLYVLIFHMHSRFFCKHKYLWWKVNLYQTAYIDGSQMTVAVCVMLSCYQKLYIDGYTNFTSVLGFLCDICFVLWVWSNFVFKIQVGPRLWRWSFGVYLWHYLLPQVHIFQ